MAFYIAIIYLQLWWLMLYLQKKVSTWIKLGPMYSPVCIICRQSLWWPLIRGHLTRTCLLNQWLSNSCDWCFALAKELLIVPLAYHFCWGPDPWWRAGRRLRYCCHRNFMRTKACIFGEANIAFKSECNFNATSFNSHRFFAYGTFNLWLIFQLTSV